MNLTRTKTINTVTKTTMANNDILNYDGPYDIYRLMLTNNRAIYKKLTNSYLTRSKKKEERNCTYLTDSWQILSPEVMCIKYNRVAKWYETKSSHEETRKDKHTQLTKANYYNIEEN